MKLRFRAEPQDVLIFVVFAIFLLYVIALGIINLPTLATEGRFAGLNPFPAFEPDNIFKTIVFYLIALGALFMSVSSYFFEREEGVGLTLNKKDKGYSRWAKEKEMKKVLKCVHPTDEKSDYAGIPLISKNGELWVDDGEYHNLVIGATGSGKTVSTILPTIKILAKKGESIICTDPKGELFEKTGSMLKAKGYNIILLNFRNPQKGNAWNPLTLPYRLYKSGNQDKAIELLDDLALNILYEENNGNADPFWEKTSADYFSGLALGMFEDTTEDKININSISLTTTVGEEKCGASTYVKEYFNLKDPNSAAYINASGTIMAPNETKGSIIAVFKQKIKLFSSRENLSEMLSYSDFDMNSIGKEKTAVFIIIQDEKKTYHSLATIFVKQCYETLIDVAQSNGGKLPCRTNFLLDEFANMPPLKDVTTMITAARSRQIRFTMIIQNFAQLKQVYGADNAETIKGNCGNLIYLISTELAALEEISKLCGEVKSKKDDKTASTPLVTVSDLQRMKQFDQIVLRMRMQPFKTSFTPDFKIDWGRKYGPIEYPEREKKPVAVFDVREFVKEKRQQKIKEMMANGGSPNPTGGMMPNMNSAYPGMPPMSNQNSGFSSHQPSNPTLRNMQGPDINMDELIKKIDAKIAEIEEEEKKAKAPEINKPSVPPKDNSNVNTSINNDLNHEKQQSIIREPIKQEFDRVGFEDKRIDNNHNSEISNKPKEASNSMDISRMIEQKVNREMNNFVPKIEKEEPKPSTFVPPAEPVKEAKEEVKKPGATITIDEEVEDNKFFDDFFDD